MRRVIAAVLVAGMAVSPAGVPVTAMAQQGGGVTTIVTNVNRVLTNVVVRDKKTGEVIKGLKQSDFQILEDKKPQQITTFDFQNVDQAVTLAEDATVSGATTTKKKSIADLVNNQFAAAP